MNKDSLKYLSKVEQNTRKFVKAVRNECNSGFNRGNDKSVRRL